MPTALLLMVYIIHCAHNPEQTSLLVENGKVPLPVIQHKAVWVWLLALFKPCPAHRLSSGGILRLELRIIISRSPLFNARVCHEYTKQVMVMTYSYYSLYWVILILYADLNDIRVLGLSQFSASLPVYGKWCRYLSFYSWGIADWL